MKHYFPPTAYGINDIRLFLVLIPCINVLNFYLTHTVIRFSLLDLAAFTIDTLQGYAAWMAIRLVILKLDTKLPYDVLPAKRITLQIVLTSIAGLSVICLLTEWVNFLATDKPLPADFYTGVIFLFLIWIFVVNAMYIGFYYFSKWRSAEVLHQTTIDQQKEKLRDEIDFLTVRSGKRSFQIKWNDILSVTVDGEYSAIRIRDGRRFFMDQSLDQLEKILPAKSFFRANRQMILHRESVAGYERLGHGKLSLILASMPEMPSVVVVSRIKAPVFKSWFDFEQSDVLQPGS